MPWVDMSGAVELPNACGREIWWHQAVKWTGDELGEEEHREWIRVGAGRWTRRFVADSSGWEENAKVHALAVKPFYMSRRRRRHVLSTRHNTEAHKDTWQVGHPREMGISSRKMADIDSIISLLHFEST